MTDRTPHGAQRHQEPDRPTSEAASDKATASEIYLDIESGYYIFIGSRGRTRIFTAAGQHQTSFRTTQGNRQRRVDEGKWVRLGRGELPSDLQ